MGLIACKECGENVSTRAKACPHCGNPVREGKLLRDAFFALIIIFVFYSVIVTLRPEVPLLDGTTKALAIDGIKQHPEIVEAAITQQGKNLKLVLVVHADTSIKEAKNLGDNFVRMIKSFSDAAPDPGEKIGTGIYSYRVSVHTEQEKNVALGAKVQTAENMTW